MSSSSSPIIPPDSPLRRSLPSSNRKFVFTVSAILALHVFLLAGILIQGCQRQDGPGTGGQVTDVDSELDPLTNTVANDPMGDTGAPPFTPTDTQPLLPPDPTAYTPPSQAPAQTNVEPAPTQIPTTATSPSVNNPPDAISAPAPVAIPQAPTTAMSTYQVKRGDNLTRIARNHGTTVNAIKQANNLKTDRILVGQKLKVPQGNQNAPFSTNPLAR